MEHTSADIIALLEALLRYNQANKILGTFVPALKNYSFTKPDGETYLHGNLNIGAVVSGRLSSSNPNLTNLPSGSKFGELIKSCFKAPPNMRFVSADYTALEAKVNALTTKDPNLIKVYTDGYDSHCINAFAYFQKQMPDIEDTVASINSIKELYSALRSSSKPCTFALQFFGTFRTLMKNLGFSEEKARRIVTSYEETYFVSIQAVQDKLRQASLDGFVTGAYGLRLLTPILEQTLFDSPDIPSAAEAEGRTAGNMLSQSYGLLNSNTANLVMAKVLDSEYRYLIKPINQIHDATYWYIPLDLECTAWFNKVVATAMTQHGCPELEHPIIKLDGEMDIHTPTWAQHVTIPNNASTDEITELLNRE